MARPLIPSLRLFAFAIFFSPILTRNAHMKSLPFLFDLAFTKVGRGILPRCLPRPLANGGGGRPFISDSVADAMVTLHAAIFECGSVAISVMPIYADFIHPLFYLFQLQS